MAILQAGNFEMEVHCHQYYPEQKWMDYSFEFRYCGQAVINPAINGATMKGANMINWDVWGDERLIPFFEKVLLQKEAASWDLWPEDHIKLKAETWQSRKAGRLQEWEGKTCGVYQNGQTSRVPYAKMMEAFEPFFEPYFDLEIFVGPHFLCGSPTAFEGMGFCLKVCASFDALEVFLFELRAEYKLLGC